MKTMCKSHGIPLDEIRVKYLRDPKRVEFALELALKEYKKDRYMDSLLDTLGLVIEAQRVS